jgi:SOS response regulatory protein OraA/RecX
VEIAYIRPTKTKRVRIGVDCDGDVSAYSLSEGMYISLSLVRGTEIDDATLSVIQGDDERYRAMTKALSLLSYGDNTRSALFLKLLRAGFCREIASDTVRECVRLGYIDERRQISRAVELEANRSLRGKELIVKKLVGKGYRISDVLSVIDELADEGVIDFARSFRDLCEKHGAKTSEERARLAYKFGFKSYDTDF